MDYDHQDTRCQRSAVGQIACWTESQQDACQQKIFNQRTISVWAGYKRNTMELAIIELSSVGDEKLQERSIKVYRVESRPGQYRKRGMEERYRPLTREHTTIGPTT